jgi:hypothetical protein
MHISLPIGAPAWAVSLSVHSPMLITLVYGLVRLARATLPGTSTERLAWWKCYWQYRRDLSLDPRVSRTSRGA